MERVTVFVSDPSATSGRSSRKGGNGFRVVKNGWTVHVVIALLLWPAAIVSGVLVSWDKELEESLLVNSLRVVNIVSTLLAMAHASTVVSRPLTLMLTSNNSTFLCRSHIRMLSSCLIYIATSSAYWFAAYIPIVCEGKDMTLDISSVLGNYNLNVCYMMSRFFATQMIFVSAGACIQLVAVFLFAYIYATVRNETWEQLVDVERLVSFHPALGAVIDNESCRDMRKFSKYWMKMSDQEIVDAIPVKALKVMMPMLNDMDTSGDGRISCEELHDFAKNNGMMDMEKISELWYILSDHNTNRFVTRSGMERVLYDVAFCRRRVAQVTYMDGLIIGWALSYVGLITYGICFVFVFKIWGYDSFGTGVDLFKTFILVATYSLSMVKGNISFILTMIAERPYDLGDVLLLDTDQMNGSGSGAGVGSNVYSVVRVTPTYTTLQGPVRLQIPNSLLSIKKPVRNISKGKMGDSLGIRFSLVRSGNDLALKVRDAVQGYADDHPDQIDGTREESIRVVWTDIDGSVGSQSLRLEVFWTYVPVIRDLSRVKWMMTHIRNSVADCISDAVKDDAMMSLTATGGAYNEK
jgi:hypothetical protein